MVTAEKKKNAAAGIWQIVDVSSGAVILKFRARKHADVTRQLQIASIGTKRPVEDFEAVYLTDWE
jgi:hypothetical protein